jgi:hypothetical protein
MAAAIACAACAACAGPTTSPRTPSAAAAWWCYDSTSVGLRVAACYRTHDECAAELESAGFPGQCAAAAVADCFSYAEWDGTPQRTCVPSMALCEADVKSTEAMRAADHPYARPGSFTACVETK